MVGYAVSHDESGNWENIDITLLDTDDFLMESYGCARLRFLYNRNTALFTPVLREPAENMCETKLLKNIVSKLRAEEMRSACAVSAVWRSFPDMGVEILDTQLCDKVWIPMPRLRDGAVCTLVDVTETFFGKPNPKPLEISMMVYVLNYLLHMSKLKISTVFFDCRTRMFMNCDFLRILIKIFDCKSDFENHPVMSSDYVKKQLRFCIFKPRISANVKEIIKNLELQMPGILKYEGNTRTFSMAVKNNCVRDCAASLVRCISNRENCSCFVSEVRKYIQKALSEYKTLSELFVAGENLYRTGDIMYLGLDDFVEACTFGESLLKLKKTVRFYAEICKALSSQKIPDIITKDGEYIFLKG